MVLLVQYAVHSSCRAIFFLSNGFHHNFNHLLYDLCTKWAKFSIRCNVLHSNLVERVWWGRFVCWKFPQIIVQHDTHRVLYGLRWIKQCIWFVELIPQSSANFFVIKLELCDGSVANYNSVQMPEYRLVFPWKMPYLYE